MTVDDSYTAYIENPNPDSLSSLVNALRSYSASIAMSYGRHDADDVASELVAKVWGARDSFRGRSSFKTWFRSLVVNHLNSLIRSERLERACLDLDTTTEEAELRSPQTGRQAVTANFEHLTQDQVAVVRILISTEDFSETANRLGISRKALERRVSRIKEKCGSLTQGAS